MSRHAISKGVSPCCNRPNQVCSLDTAYYSCSQPHSPSSFDQQVSNLIMCRGLSIARHVKDVGTQWSKEEAYMTPTEGHP